ncbi:N2227-like protein-domain-containing protein [Microdochium bolleyi]|uniref:N2227-like protein-domain-containing protein n=1 Tax=Microdochium bolleyi TaxID=196109 RepID=A0A136J8G3_9PEZI|nr:N2227-like protein-domain-containing protein [Microdochium bolleyi]
MHPGNPLRRALFLLCTASQILSSSVAGEDAVVELQDEPQLEAFHADTVQAILVEATVITTVNATEEPACVFPFEQCSPRHRDEKNRLMQRLDRKDGTWNTNHPRWRLLKAIDGFASYGRLGRAEVKRWRDMYAHVPQEQKAVLEAAVPYKTKLNTVEHHIATNAALAEAVAAHSMSYYGITHKELNDFIRAEEKAGRGSEKHSVVQALKHYVRDWSLEGAQERDAAFPCILAALEGVRERQRKIGSGKGGREDEKALTVLLPGSGLGRLGHEVASLGGFDVTINEWSTYMIAAYRYIEANLSPIALSLAASDDSTSPPISFHPFIDSLSHHASNDNLFRKITLSPFSPLHSSSSSSSSSPSPPTHKNIFHPASVVLAEGDFTTIFAQQQQHDHQQYDVIITHFFIDTARNLLSYLSTIHALLSPGGHWINLGPLLYGTGPWVQLSLDEVVLVSERMGFEFEDLPSPASTQAEGEHVCGVPTFPDAAPGSGLSRVRGRYAGYGFDERALTRNAYQAQAWVARKK